MTELHQRAGVVSGLLAQALAGPVPAALEPRTQTERLLAHLQQADRSLTRAELAEAFPDISANSLSGALASLYRSGKIARPGRGAYRSAGRSS